MAEILRWGEERVGTSRSDRRDHRPASRAEPMPRLSGAQRRGGLIMAGHPGGHPGSSRHPGGRPPGIGAVRPEGWVFASAPMIVYWELTTACGLACRLCGGAGRTLSALLTLTA